eukprot:gnl/Hemi2/11179_TR3865_c0_g1_i1.p3 gnl/Hemi2/11179_TR3865_c0_g1~~gnl/Hemi2/11179_TR3865_c0_g1_i1.p3  ORF type:complete len:106 (-),score=25.17 gnl/Hemi2/11179_TR3865_c0_g1_i1:103-420(-)
MDYPIKQTLAKKYNHHHLTKREKTFIGLGMTWAAAGFAFGWPRVAIGGSWKAGYKRIYWPLLPTMASLYFIAGLQGANAARFAFPEVSLDGEGHGHGHGHDEEHH